MSEESSTLVNEPPLEAEEQSKKKSWRDRWLVRILSRFLWLTVVLIASLLILSLIYPQNFANENRWYLLGVSILFLLRLGLFHIGIALIFIALFALILKRKSLAFISLVLMLSCLAPFAWNARPKSPTPAIGKTVRIFSINTFARNRDPQKLVTTIRDENPDLIVFVELTGKIAEKILPQIDAEYPYQHISTYASGATIFSRYPLRVEPYAPTTDYNAMRPVVVFSLDGREVALYGVHLLSPSRTLKQESSHKLVGTLGFAMKMNRQQIIGLESILRDSKYPCIFAGDFNFPPYTPSFERLTKLGLSEGHRVAGTGLGNTWRPIWWKPLTPIARAQLDHVFVTKELTITSCRVGPDVGSDHLPVIVDVGLREKK